MDGIQCESISFTNVNPRYNILVHTFDESHESQKCPDDAEAL
jgi:hypothetical protein